MAVLLSFWNEKLNSEMLKMKRCKDETAEGLFNLANFGANLKSKFGHNS
jgi:hypothetical protein